MTDLEKIKGRVRKLLALSKSDNENEAIAALEKVIERTGKNGLTCGIAYAAGILNRYHGRQAAQFVLKESGMKSLQELRDAGCEEFDIENIGDLLPEDIVEFEKRKV